MKDEFLPKLYCTILVILFITIPSVLCGCETRMHRERAVIHALQSHGYDECVVLSGPVIGVEPNASVANYGWGDKYRSWYDGKYDVLFLGEEKIAIEDMPDLSYGKRYQLRLCPVGHADYQTEYSGKPVSDKYQGAEFYRAVNAYEYATEHEGLTQWNKWRPYYAFPVYRVVWIKINEGAQ